LPDREDFISIPFSTLLASSATEPDLLLHAPGDASIQLGIRPGDFNVDGFPDLLITISNGTAVPHAGPFGGSRGTQVRVLQNVPCRKGIPGCEGKQKRGFEVKSGKGWEVLDHIVDATGASWIDIDDDVSCAENPGVGCIDVQGSLDVMVQRSGEQGQGKVTFIQNNFYHDAFFLKAQGESAKLDGRINGQVTDSAVLNGACDGDCQPTSGGGKYKVSADRPGVWVGSQLTCSRWA
jgi:integrin alpha FG-GAP repeat containing protein 1